MRFREHFGMCLEGRDDNEGGHGREGERETIPLINAREGNVDGTSVDESSWSGSVSIVGGRVSNTGGK